MSTSLEPDVVADALASLPATIEAGLEIVAARRLGNPEDVREAVQETLARTLSAVRERRIPSGVSVGAYAGGILRHVVADRLRELVRHRGNGAPVDPDTLPAPHHDPLQHLVGLEEIARVRRALRRLPAADRSLLRRVFVVGERVADIARRSGEPPERVRQRKFRALRRLRELLAEDIGVTDTGARRQGGHEHG